MKLRVVLEVEFAERDAEQWSKPPRILAQDASMWILNKLGIGPGPKDPPELRDAKIVQTQIITGPRHATPLEGQVVAAVEDITRRIDPEDEEP